MKTLLLFFFTAILVHAQAPTASVIAETKMEMTRGKGSVVLKAGSTVQVIGKEGDSLLVIYRGIPGVLPRAKTDFKGEAPDAVIASVAAAESKRMEKSTGATVAVKPAETKPATPQPVATKPASSKPTSSSANPTTTYGKAVKKARDSVAAHEEAMVDPTNEQTAAPKKK
jgi:hypothetical protein